MRERDGHLEKLIAVEYKNSEAGKNKSMKGKLRNGETTYINVPIQCRKAKRLHLQHKNHGGESRLQSIWKERPNSRQTKAVTKAVTKEEL